VKPASFLALSWLEKLKANRVSAGPSGLTVTSTSWVLNNSTHSFASSVSTAGFSSEDAFCLRLEERPTPKKACASIRHEGVEDARLRGGAELGGDRQTLEFCARHAINPGYFLVYPRADAATVCYVDETDAKALEVAAFRASRAYEGFLAPPQPDESFADRVAAFAKMFVGRGEPGASEIMRNVPDMSPRAAIGLSLHHQR
jgi:hypothetical protein